MSELLSEKLKNALEYSDIEIPSYITSNLSKELREYQILALKHFYLQRKNPKTNHHNAGFTDEERNKMTELLKAGFTDTFRYLYPEKENAYTWWSYMFHAREKNAGWRIDYFIVSNRIADKIVDAKIHNEIMGSDHCPIELDIKL